MEFVTGGLDLIATIVIEHFGDAKSGKSQTFPCPSTLEMIDSSQNPNRSTPTETSPSGSSYSHSQSSFETLERSADAVDSIGDRGQGL